MKKTLFSILAVACTMAASAQINDPSFEAGIGSGAWTEYSTFFGTPLCDAGCGTGGAPYDGTFYAWFGGAAVDSSETAILSQDITIPAGNSASLTFWMKINPGTSVASDFVAIFFNGDTIPSWGVTTANAASYTAYTQVTIDVTNMADGAVHNLLVGSNTTGGAGFLIDKFDLTVNGGSVDVFNNQMNQEKAIAVFPSPANEQINVQFNGMMTGNATVKIFDVTGNLVNQEFLSEVSNKVFSYNVSALPNGVYMMDVNNNGTVQTQRFVVAH